MEKYLLFCLVITNCVTGNAQSSSSGPFSAATFSNNTSVGSISWSNPNNTASSNNSHSSAYALALGDVTNYLTATNFSFNIPSSAYIDGIEVNIERSSSGVLENITDNSVRLIKGGTITGNNKAATGSWPTSDATKNYGSNSDLWGTTWSAADINSSDFGVAISANLNGISVLPHAKIDHIEITVHYTILTPLPVDLIHFSAEETINGVLLKWQTASEENNDYFAVERSLDGLVFNELGQVKGAGNSPALISYTYCDINCATGAKNYYRLKQVDYNGTLSYSDIIYHSKTNNFIINSLYTITDKKIILQKPANKNFTICIYNIQGQLILQTNAIEIPLDYLPKGILILGISGNSGSKFYKVLNQ